MVILDDKPHDMMLLWQNRKFYIGWKVIGVSQPGIQTEDPVDKDWSAGEQGGFSQKGLTPTQCRDFITECFILSFSDHIHFST